MRTLSAVATGLAGWLLALPAVQLVAGVWAALVRAAGWPEVPQDMVRYIREADSAGEFAIWTLLVVVLAPVTEELIFRRGVFRFLAGRMPWAWAAVSSALFFAFLHGNIVSFAPLVLFGFALALVYRRTGRLAAPIAMHMAFNLPTLVALVIEPAAAS